jgi:hypothetical protein
MSLAPERTLNPTPTSPVRFDSTPLCVAVADRHRATRLRMRRWTVAAIFLSAATFFLVALVALAIVDWIVELNHLSRGLFLLGLVSAFGWGMIAAWRQWVSPYSLETTVDLEEVSGGPGLPAKLDYQEAALRDFSPPSTTTIPALIAPQSRDNHAHPIPWDERAPQRWFWRSALACLLVGIATLLALILLPELRTATTRLLLG